MKISQKQASLLAKEVQKQLQKMKVGEVPQSVITAVKQYKEKRAELLAICKEHDENYRKHEATWKRVVGLSNEDRIYASDNLETIIEKLKQRDVPRVSEIEDEIILNAMFSNDDDLKTFVDKIAKKFEKKTRNKILSN